MPPPSSSRTIITVLSASSGPGLRDSLSSQASAPTVASAPSSTNVSSPLTLEMPGRLGLRGGWGGAGGTTPPGAGLLVRPNRLTRGWGASPSPESNSPLMSSTATALPPSTLKSQARAGLDAPVRGLQPSLADGAARGNNESPLGFGQFIPRKTSEALVPPNPNELDNAAWIGRLRAACGARSIAVSTAGLSRLSVGGAIWSRIARMEKIASTAPAAPRRWPIEDFVEDMVVLAAELPSSRSTACNSISSPTVVDVPCALT